VQQASGEALQIRVLGLATMLDVTLELALAAIDSVKGRAACQGAVKAPPAASADISTRL
jgi:hypothetical protein